MTSSPRPSREAREPSPDWPPLSAAPIRGDTFDPAEIEPRLRWVKISSGGYANVYETKMVGGIVAVKESSDKKATSTPSLLREIRYLRQCGPHPNIVQLYGSFRQAGRVCLVMEHGKYVLRLSKVVRNVNLVKVLSGVVRALVRLHACGLIHRDVKSRNVLVTSKGSGARAILIDFGLACNLRDDPAQWLARAVGTRKHRPPEMGTESYLTAHPSVDIYSFGVMIRMILGQMERDDWEEQTERRTLEDLEKRCTVADPKGRPTAWEVLCVLQDQAQHGISLSEDSRERIELYSSRPGSTSTSKSSSQSTSSSSSAHSQRSDANSQRSDEEEGGRGDHSGDDDDERGRDSGREERQGEGSRERNLAGARWRSSAGSENGGAAGAAAPDEQRPSTGSQGSCPREGGGGAPGESRREDGGRDRGHDRSRARSRSRSADSEDNDDRGSKRRRKRSKRGKTQSKHKKRRS